MEKVEEASSWNKKRIFAALFIIFFLAIGGYFFKTRVLDATSSNQELKSVKGISSKAKNKSNGNDVSIDIPKAVREQIDNLKQEVSGLNILEIASSSPQVQKILNDVKALEQYPTNQLKEICKKICGL